MTPHQAKKRIAGARHGCMRIEEVLVCCSHVSIYDRATADTLGLKPFAVGFDDWERLTSLHFSKRIIWLRAKQIAGDM